MLGAESVVEILDRLAAARIAVWLDGGWGVDALIGRQTREHGDLDLVVAASDSPAVQTALEPLGYRHDIATDCELPARLMLSARDRGGVDVHPVLFDDGGNGWWPFGNDAWGLFSAEGLSGTGSIAGRSVACLTPALQVHRHLHNPLAEWHRRDLRLLAEFFGLSVPPSCSPRTGRDGRWPPVRSGARPRPRRETVPVPTVCRGGRLPGDPGTGPDLVLEILDRLRAAQVVAWLEGGWGLDALIGRQTRPHDDLDLVVAQADCTAVERALEPLGYRHDVSRDLGLPAKLLLTADDLGDIDVHPVLFDETGDAWWSFGCDVWRLFPARGLSGEGTLAGRRVRCITPEVQLYRRLDLPLEEKNRRDLCLLAEVFGLSVPPSCSTRPRPRVRSGERSRPAETAAVE